MITDRIAKRIINEALDAKADKLVKRLKEKLEAEQTDDSIINDELKGDQYKLDLNKNKRLDKDDFKRLRSKKSIRKHRSEQTDDSIINDELKGDQYKLDLNRNKKLDSDDFKKLRNRGKKKGKKTLKLNEAEMTYLIYNIVQEEKKAKGLAETEKTLKKSKDENKKALADSAKKMSDYVKYGSKGKYDPNPKHFPKGNGELAKMDKKAYVPSDAVDEYVDAFSHPGMTNLIPDEIHFDDELISRYLKGDSKSGNSSKYANSVETELGEKMMKNYKNNYYGQEQKKASYKRYPQPVDISGEKSGAKGLGLKAKKGKKTSSDILSKLESIEDSNKSSLNEEFNRMNNILFYNKKTQ